MNGSLISPEAVIMLPLAILLDLIGIVLICFALDDFFITDIIGIVFIGGWIYFRSGAIKTTKGAKEKAGKIIKKMKKLKRLRFLCIGAELIPYIGALPSWTILVYFELKS
jgi:hypothetical protein